LPAAAWNEVVVQPDPVLHDSGFYDALTRRVGIPVGGGEGGFAVTFDWLGPGTPGHGTPAAGTPPETGIKGASWAPCGFVAGCATGASGQRCYRSAAHGIILIWSLRGLVVTADRKIATLAHQY